MLPSLSIRMQMKPSLKLVLAGKYLQATCDELDGLISQEIAANPFLARSGSGGGRIQGLETPIGGENWNELPQYRQHIRSMDSYTDTREMTSDLIELYPERETVVAQLTNQICLIAKGPCRSTAVDLLPYLDEHGYLPLSEEDLSRELGVEIELIRSARKILLELEPPGIGASDIRHCLLIQCVRLEEDGYFCVGACKILEVAWNEFLHQRWDQVAKMTGMSSKQVEEAVIFLRNNCHPYPLSLLDDPNDLPYSLNRPDLILHIVDDKYSLEIPEEQGFSLEIKTDYLSKLKGGQGHETSMSIEDMQWITKHLGRANLIIKALQQRWKTLRQVGEYIIEHQSLCLGGNGASMAPIARKKIAKKTGLSESTICRAVKNKVLQLPNGRLILLSNMFERSLPIKNCIKKIITESDSPLSDLEISQRLEAFGYPVARRTVTKYRGQINLPNRYLRKQSRLSKLLPDLV
jgi:RNA polymerase sigma-54 factor